MARFGMLKKRKKKKQEETYNAEEIIRQEDKPGSELVETTLSFSENYSIPNEERYVYAFHNSQSPKLKANQISIYPVDIRKMKNKSLIAKALVKNTVNKSIYFTNTTILLLDANKQVIAKKEFDLANLGTLPPNTARPWKFVFMKDDIDADKQQDFSDWSLAFEVKRKHLLDLEESWENSIAEETKSSLQKIIDKAEPLKTGELNFMGIQAKRNDKDELLATILIRNGSDKNVTLKQVSLGVKDATGEEIARGNFKMQDFTVKSNTSKPWTFIFPPSLIKSEDIDLSKWQVYPLQ